ncbi:MAG: S8 family serine peptidase, partial [Candidatus Hydrothermarchaeaceae archaeon]
MKSVRAYLSWLPTLCTISIVCMLMAGIAAAQPVDGGEENKKITDRGSKIAPLVTEKIKGAVSGEELPLIIFYKTGFSRTMAQDMAIVESHGGKVKHRYRLIDAVSAKMPADRIAELAESPDIEKIYYDEIYKIPPEPTPGQNESIKLDVSTQTIGANYARDTLGFTGSGITVAVIDTGIDYNHPDLGGGWGNRVVGGYDFSNGDINPMDDHGHGTHVAGIVGANGTLKGVASDVDLLAVKVLDAVGEGSASDIIAGIDWAVANGADIISMSLGGNYQPNDEFASPSTIIVDAAVDAGVVVVIAAGNEGPGTGTTASPGTGRKVITVGASDDKGTVDTSDDAIADFSNRGPSAFGR